MSALVPVEPNNVLALTSYLEQARDWLARAVHEEDAATIANAKAEIATAAEATKQLNLSKEIQLDAQEMVRRAEFALGKAIRRGQAEGSITKSGPTLRRPGQHLVDNGVLRMSDLVTSSEWIGNVAAGATGISAMVDGAQSTEEFDAAIDAAKAEGNLSRANVVRKIKGQRSHETRDDRANQIDLLASKGASVPQIAAKVGIGEEAVRNIIRDYDIYVPADAVVRGSRRINDNRVLDNVTESLEVAAMCLRDIDPAKLDQEEALERLDSLTDSIRAIAKAVKKIKESIHE